MKSTKVQTLGIPTHTFPVHHAMTTCTDKLRSQFDFRMECSNGTFYKHSPCSALAIASLFFRLLNNFTCNVSEALMLAMRVLLCSSLSKVCSCVLEALMLAMRVLLLYCFLNVSSRDSKALLRFSGLLAVLRASLFKVKA